MPNQIAARIRKYLSIIEKKGGVVQFGLDGLRDVAAKIAQVLTTCRLRVGNQQADIDLVPGCFLFHGVPHRRHWLNNLLQSVRYRKKGGKLVTLGTLLRVNANSLRFV